MKACCSGCSPSVSLPTLVLDLAQPFGRLDAAAVDLREQHVARVGLLAVQQDGAIAALAGVAAAFHAVVASCRGARQQVASRRALEGDRLAVDLDANLHGSPPAASSSATGPLHQHRRHGLRDTPCCRGVSVSHGRSGVTAAAHGDPLRAPPSSSCAAARRQDRPAGLRPAPAATITSRRPATSRSAPTATTQDRRVGGRRGSPRSARTYRLAGSSTATIRWPGRAGPSR